MIAHLMWQLGYNAAQQPAYWWAEHGDYHAEIDFSGGSILPRKWTVRNQERTVLQSGTSASLTEAKDAVARAIVEADRG